MGDDTAVEGHKRYLCPLIAAQPTKGLGGLDNIVQGEFPSPVKERG